jgi:hypothetical protein
MKWAHNNKNNKLTNGKSEKSKCRQSAANFFFFIKIKDQIMGGHSGTISSKQLEIKKFFKFFFVLFVDLNPSDDFFKKKKLILSRNGENLSLEKFDNFFCKSGFLPFLPFLVLFLANF